MSDCAFCEALKSNMQIRAFLNKQREKDHEEKIYEDYTVALVSRSYLKGRKSHASRTTDYRYAGIGYKLNYCPECGREV